VIADNAPVARESAVAARLLDERCAEEDPQEARREGDPGGEKAAEHAGRHRRERPGIAVGGQETDELQHHD